MPWWEWGLSCLDCGGFNIVGVCVDGDELYRCPCGHEGPREEFE